MGRKAVLFDLYGTLLVAAGSDASDSPYEALEGTQFALSLGLGGAALRAFIDDLWRHPARRPRDDGLTIFEGRFHDRALARGHEVSREAICEAADRSVTAWQQGWNVDGAAAAVIGELRRRGNAIGLVSNFDHWPHVGVVLRAHGLDRLFDAVTVSGEVGFYKPDPQIFHKALEQLGVDAARATHVGDDDVDVHGALAVGARPIRIVRGAGGGQPAGEQVVRTLDELLDLLQ